MTNLPILCVGALTMDTIFEMSALPEEPGKFIPLGAVEIAAGMASSAACSIARLGGRVDLWASVGSDPTGQRLRAEMGEEGVNCSYIRSVPEARSAFSTILVDQHGERIIVPHYDPALLGPPEIAPPITADRVAAVMADVRWPRATTLALTAARQAGIPAILDADVADIEILRQLVPLASHVVASEPAAALLTDNPDPASALVALAERYHGFMAITAGGDGVYWFDREARAVRHCPAPKVVVRDTLAAGDVFHGAFALALVEQRPMDWIMAFASAAAAIKCSRFGGRGGAPTRAETEALMASAATTG